MHEADVRPHGMQDSMIPVPHQMYKGDDNPNGM